MFNLASLLGELADELDPDKRMQLNEITAAASKLRSLHSRGGRSVTKGSTLGTIDEDVATSGYEEEDNLGVFGSHEVLDVLNEMSYKLTSVSFAVHLLSNTFHPQLCDSKFHSCSTHILLQSSTSPTLLGLCISSM